MTKPKRYKRYSAEFKREAIVTFDDALTDIEILTQATANAGFPSRLKTQIQ